MTSVAMKVLATAVALACVTLSPVDATSALPAPLIVDAQTSLVTLAVSHEDPGRAWRQYEALVLSKTRSTPLVLFFEGDSNVECARISSSNNSNSERDGGDSDDDSDDSDDSEPSAETEACLVQLAERSELLLTALDTVARTYKASGLLIVRVPALLLPQMTRYHRVAPRPSLLWLAPRSANGFQRYPHPETNALDLSAPKTLLATASSSTTSTTSTSTGQRQPPAVAVAVTGDQSPSEQLAAVVGEFVRQWFVKSGLAPASSARTGVVPAASPSSSESSDDASSQSVIEYVPVLALLAFAGAVAFENRALLHQTLAGRFVWFVWSAGVMYAAYSGVFHALIHRAPLFYFSPQAGLYLFHPSGRRQFVLEGLVSGAWSFCVSLGAFSIAEILPMQHAALARTDVFAFSILIMIVACVAVHLTFMAKTPWLA